MTARQPRPGGRRAALLVVWVLATMGGLLVASTTKIGPVVLALTARHGVHEGDLVGFGIFYGIALLATLVFRPRRAPARPTSPPLPAWPRGSGADAPTVRLHPAPGYRAWSDGPTRPIRTGTAHPDDPYGRQAG
ncbi:hypothetical protein [Pseudonocardia lacus]|uniref:hypothetical protein n=1 Tax=Pseudonocardia lacus TaxID=2835865 RepID=UPI001BDCEB81|nr:hypothetical protein [Pseudonocardia lacus]